MKVRLLCGVSDWWGMCWDGSNPGVTDWWGMCWDGSNLEVTDWWGMCGDGSNTGVTGGVCVVMGVTLR